MKIAYVYDAVYPWVKGGAEKRIYEISRRLAARGHEVHCYGMKWWPGHVDIETEGVHLHGICPPMPLYRNGKRSISQAAYFAGRMLALRTDCDVLDCQNFPYLSCFSAKLISRLQGPKLFITWLEVWGEYWKEYLGAKGRAGQAVEWAAARLTDRNIAISRKTQRDLLSLGAREAQIVPPGIDWRMISGIAPSSKPSDIIYVGRLIEHKNVDLLIRALKGVKSEIPDVRVLIVGDGPEMNNLKLLAKRLHLEQSIRFLGFVEDYVASTVVAQPPAEPAAVATLGAATSNVMRAYSRAASQTRVMRQATYHTAIPERPRPQMSPFAFAIAVTS